MDARRRRERVGMAIASDKAGASVSTLRDVAALAGVSLATASRVINGSPQVTVASVAAVMGAVAKLNYVPNRAARSLARRKTHMIAMVIPEQTSKFFADPYFAAVIQGAAMRVSSTDYTLTLLIESDTDPQKTMRFLEGGNVDGALILARHSRDASYVELSRTLPVVFGVRPLIDDGTEHYVVDVDNVEVAITATRHLIERGLSAHRDDRPAPRHLGWYRSLSGLGAWRCAMPVSRRARSRSATSPPLVAQRPCVGSWIEVRGWTASWRPPRRWHPGARRTEGARDLDSRRPRPDLHRRQLLREQRRSTTHHGGHQDGHEGRPHGREAPRPHRRRGRATAHPDPHRPHRARIGVTTEATKMLGGGCRGSS
jgi:hypothetical protein